jgi:integrase
LVERATGRLKLHLLLMANCGYTQRDLADLRQNEVDWSNGRIIRKRSKTGDIDKVPVVNYRLWPQTWDLLRECREDGPLVLLTESGRPLVRDEIGPDGKRHKTDTIHSTYRHLQVKLGFAKSTKLIRKTSATLLDGHAEFCRFVGHFLGHAPRTIQEKHYTPPSEERFDRAVEWLGQQYGFVLGT